MEITLSTIKMRKVNQSCEVGCEASDTAHIPHEEWAEKVDVSRYSLVPGIKKERRTNTEVITSHRKHSNLK